MIFLFAQAKSVLIGRGAVNPSTAGYFFDPHVQVGKVLVGRQAFWATRTGAKG